jgi:hypothetical protein
MLQVVLCWKSLVSQMLAQRLEEIEISWCETVAASSEPLIHVTCCYHTFLNTLIAE